MIKPHYPEKAEGRVVLAPVHSLVTPCYSQHIWLPRISDRDI